VALMPENEVFSPASKPDVSASTLTTALPKPATVPPPIRVYRLRSVYQ
jgi:hypothetical protein